MTTLLPWLTKAGNFPVEHIAGIPLFEVVPIDMTAPAAGVAHTTEGDTIEGALSVFKRHYAPHFLLGRDENKAVRILQLVQVGVMGLALEAHNVLARVQVEIVGHSDEQPWLPDSEVFEALAAFFAACHAEYAIPLSHPWPDGDYGMAGYHTAHRASGKFGRIASWFAHADVPDNAHWDVGNMKWSAVMGRAAEMEHAHLPPTPIRRPPSRPCAAPTVDVGLIASVQSASADTKAAIAKALSDG